MYTKVYITTQWDLFQVYQVGSTLNKSINVTHHINRLKRKKCMSMSVGEGTAFDKI